MKVEDLIAELQKKNPKEPAIITVAIGDNSGYHELRCCLVLVDQDIVDGYELTTADVGDLCVTVQL